MLLLFFRKMIIEALNNRTDIDRDRGRDRGSYLDFIEHLFYSI